ncbi:MAG: autotransporter domain-containing protein, partial [Deltaproteobacteria bacterium]
LKVGKLAAGGSNSSLGATVAGTPIIMGTAGNAATLEYTGTTGDSSDRQFSVGALSAATIKASAAGFTDLTLSGAIANAGTGLTFDIAAAGGTLTESGLISGIGSLTKLSAGTLVLSGANTYTGGTTITAGMLQARNAQALGNTGAVLNNGTGTLDVGIYDVGSIARVGAYTQGANASLNVTVDSWLTSGSLMSTGIATTSSAVTSIVNMSVGAFLYVPTGATFTIIDTAGAGVTNIPGTINTTGGNRHVKFNASIGTGNLVMTGDRSQYGFASDATDSNARNVGQALDNVLNPSPDMTNVLNAMEGLTPAQTASALDTMYPDVSSGALQGSRVLTGNSFKMISNRMGGARNNGAVGSGVSSGDMTNGLGVWMQGLGSFMKQDERKGIKGFSANTWGTTIGADKVIDDHFRAGLAGGYSWAGVHSKQGGSPSDSINSWQATVYGSYDSLNLTKARQGGKKSYEAVRTQVEDSWYVDGMMAFTQNDYDSRREIWVTGLPKRVSKADHYGQQYSTNFEAGYKFVFEETKNLEVTPFASLGYNYLYMNKYKEKGADALSLRVDGQGYNQLEQGLGAKLAYPIVAKKIGTFIPSAKAAWLYDYIGDRFETTASFAGGGPFFNSQGAKPAKSGMLFGAELAFLNKGNMTVTGNWDVEIKDQYLSNTYYGTVRYDF